LLLLSGKIAKHNKQERNKQVQQKNKDFESRSGFNQCVVQCILEQSIDKIDDPQPDDETDTCPGLEEDGIYYRQSCYPVEPVCTGMSPILQPHFFFYPLHLNELDRSCQFLSACLRCSGLSRLFLLFLLPPVNKDEADSSRSLGTQNQLDNHNGKNIHTCPPSVGLSCL